MIRNRVSLKDAVKFHGHLGPYLVLGILAGDLAIKKLGCKKYFGLDVRVWGANKRPKSCLIDGLQLSTGATYGKGNIHKFNGSNIRILIRSLENKGKIVISLKKALVGDLNKLKGHQDSEAFAKRLLTINHNELFNTLTASRPYPPTFPPTHLPSHLRGATMLRRLSHLVGGKVGG